MPLLFDSLFSSVALGHLVVDVMNGQRSVLLTYWSSSLGLTNAMLALISTIYIWAASLSQPGFGWITDRFHHTRLMAAGGILWMAALFGLALFLPTQAAIPCLILASFGSAAFHPAGTMQATLRGQTHLSQKETTAASWFFLFGQGGYFVGPIVGGPLLDLFGPAGLLLLAGIAAPVGLNAAWQLRHTHRPIAVEVGLHGGAGYGDVPAAPQTISRTVIVALALTAALQAWAQQNMITFVPKYLSDLGQTAATYGLVAGLFMGGSAMGNVIGGNLADRFGKQRVAMTMLLLATIPLFTISRVGWSPWLYLLIPLAGSLTGAVHSIVVVLAQRALPAGMATASGLALGFMFSAGALGTLVCGSLADAWGFPHVFMLTSGLTFVAAFVTLVFRHER
jgi:FSR family fosmidomycin resistance protein-like MFS transporter